MSPRRGWTTDAGGSDASDICPNRRGRFCPPTVDASDAAGAVVLTAEHATKHRTFCTRCLATAAFTPHDGGSGGTRNTSGSAGAAGLSAGHIGGYRVQRLRRKPWLAGRISTPLRSTST